MKRSTRVKPDVCQEVTNRLISLIESGTPPWRRPWSSYGPAMNYATGHVYTGINFFLLNFMPNFEIPLYLTYKQARDLGGQVRKGAKAERVYFFKSLYKDKDGNRLSADQVSQHQQSGKPVRCIPIPKTFAVFNVADVDGIDFNLPELREHPNEPVTTCEAFLAGLRNVPPIIHDDPETAFYSPSRDIINIPPLSRFVCPANYYKTTFHELTHSTGHRDRLARPAILKVEAPTHPTYAQEELVAELGAAFLCHHLRIDNRAIVEHSAAYLEHFLEPLRNDKRLIFRAASAAQRAVNFLVQHPE